jgi:nucleoside-diphosphate-sugar epimerase
MTDAPLDVGVIGPKGFIGSNLARRSNASAVYGRNDGTSLASSNHELLICSGVPAEKWKANKHPEEDKRNLVELTKNLSTANAKNFVLISTIDVLGNGADLVESDNVSNYEKDAYGINRFEFELDTVRTFSNSLVLRLPGMYGPGLKKNVIFDLLNANELPSINPYSTFQWFDVRDIWPTLILALRENLKILHLATEPISILDLVTHLEPSRTTELSSSDLGTKEYSMKTEFSRLIADRDGPYLKSKMEVLSQIKNWYDSEKSLKK